MNDEGPRRIATALSPAPPVPRSAQFPDVPVQPHADPDDPYTLAVVIGSVRTGRVGDAVAAWFAEQVGQREIKLDLIDLAEVKLSPSLDDTPQLRAFASRLDAADAFVIVTPEYHHGYPAYLKLAIDSVRAPWRAKPVAFVSYGGQSGGLRAVEQLRLVFAELDAVSVRETVAFPHIRRYLDEAGRVRPTAATTVAAGALLDALTWWSVVLRDARAHRPQPS